jgi:hypothetical protein
MANKHSSFGELFKAIADAIRAKNGTTGTIIADNFPEEIAKINTARLQTKTVSSSTATQTVKPDSGYNGLSQVTVTGIGTATQATPSVSVSATGLITASATQSEGYVSAGTKSATKQLSTKSATTITPSAVAQTAVSAGTYVTGTITVAAVSTYDGSVV